MADVSNVIAEVALRSPNTHTASEDAGSGGKGRGESWQSGPEIDAAANKPLSHRSHRPILSKTASPKLTFKPVEKPILKNATFQFCEVRRILCMT